MENIFSKPFGWELEEFGFSHNLWLDVARFGGIIPFSLLLILTYRSVRIFIRTIKANNQSLLLNTVLICYLLALFLIFMVEPIMEGLFFLFSIYCLFTGMSKKHLDLILTTKKLSSHQ
jgi:hypothetical protein